MNKKVNELIPKALTAITASGMVDAGKVDKEYKGYISSMGASIIQSGLLPTLAFYSNEFSDSGKKKLKLITALHILIENVNNPKLLNYVLSGTHNGINKAEIDKYEKKISNALIALKLALRTFKQKEQ